MVSDATQMPHHKDTVTEYIMCLRLWLSNNTLKLRRGENAMTVDTAL